MKLPGLVILLVALSAPFVFGVTPEEAFGVAVSSLEEASTVTNGAEISKLESAWSQLPEIKKAAMWPEMSLAYVKHSEKLLSAKMPSEAAQYLTLAGRLNQNFGGRLEYATKSPDTFFEHLAQLQTEIASKTGSDPLAGAVDYLFQKNGEEYIVARQELDPEVSGVTIAGVSETESLVQARYFAVHDEKVTLEKVRWLIGPKGNVANTLNHATREVLQDQYGRYDAQPLQSSVLASAAQTNEPRQPEKSTPVSLSATPMQQPKSTASSSPTAETKLAPSSFPILPAAIIGAVIVGIVFYLLRRKST